MSVRYGQVRAADGRLVVGRVLWLDTFLLRLRGLLGRPPLADGEGAYLVPCRGVHSVGMRDAIDVCYLAPDGRVLRTLCLRPGRFGPHVRAALGVLELPAGALARLDIQEGQRLRLLAPTAGSEGLSSRERRP